MKSWGRQFCRVHLSCGSTGRATVSQLLTVLDLQTFEESQLNTSSNILHIIDPRFYFASYFSAIYIQ